MNILNRIRCYHATLAVLAFLAYATGELGIVHAWLGYGVAIVIVLRLLWALSGERQMGLMRFYPSFEGFSANNIFTHPAISKVLMLGIAVSLLAVTLTGIAIDKGKAIGLSKAKTAITAHADDSKEIDEDEKEGLLGETHELFANMLLLFVGMHVSYLILFKRPLAKFMLFIAKAESKNKNNNSA